MNNIELDKDLLDKLKEIYDNGTFDIIYDTFNEFLNVSLNQAVNFLKDWRQSDYNFVLACLVSEDMLRNIQNLSDKLNKPLHEIKSEIVKLGYEILKSGKESKENITDFEFNTSILMDEGYSINNDGEWTSNQEVRELLEEVMSNMLPKKEDNGDGNSF